MSQNESYLKTSSLPGLIARFSVPSIISMLVTAIYNLTDQIFIGNLIGMTGNAATNVVFPLTTLCTAIAQLSAIGTASNFNISLGAGNKERARRFLGNGLTLLSLSAVLFFATLYLFKRGILLLCGATATVYPMADTYLSVTGVGFPFILFTTGACVLIRADGSPRYAMFCTVVGALINIALDAWFMIGLHMGIFGAALATSTGQVISFLFTAAYFFRFKTVRITRGIFRLHAQETRRILSLGLPNFFNLLIMSISNIVLNNTLTAYGAKTVYGSDIPLAVSGIVNKLQSILIAFVVGTAQGCQPILSYNMGAGEYGRVKETYKIAALIVESFSVLAFLLFQFFPRQITSLFGSGDTLYFTFAVRYLRVYLGAVFLFGFQPLTVNFFTSIGDTRKGLVLSIARQGLILIPLLILLPALFGLDGALAAGPLAEALACALSLFMVRRSFQKLTKKQTRKAA